MNEQLGPYRVEDGFALIELRLSSVAQLFNWLDPAPFRERDLDPEADAYIVGAARELGARTRIKLVVWLPAAQIAAALAAELPAAVASYFGHRAVMERRNLRFLLADGRLAFAIGLGFLAACVAARQLVMAAWTGNAGQILAEGLLIAGWVALWRPLQIGLYDWWPVLRSARIHEALAAAPVEMRQSPPAAPAPT
ncbi:MAG: hypothetical protein IT557_11380 [Alphaproteobacteria bacterium]|nr:hypothetical protein [Alphaproteobacteria bacterium]